MTCRTVTTGAGAQQTGNRKEASGWALGGLDVPSCLSWCTVYGPCSTQMCS